MTDFFTDDSLDESTANTETAGPPIDESAEFLLVPGFQPLFGVMLESLQEKGMAPIDESAEFVPAHGLSDFFTDY